MRESLTQCNYMRTLSGQCRVCPHKDPAITSSIYYSNKWTFNNFSFICLVRAELNLFNKCVSLGMFSKWKPKKPPKGQQRENTTKSSYFDIFVALLFLFQQHMQLGIVSVYMSGPSTKKISVRHTRVVRGDKRMERSLYPVNLWL